MNLPAWNLESVYPSIHSPEFAADEKRCEDLIGEFSSRTEKIRHLLSPETESSESLIADLQSLLILNLEMSMLSYDLATYIRCLETVDAKDEAAKAKSSQLQNQRSRYSQAIKPLQIFMSSCDQSLFDQIFSHPDLQGSLFLWQQERMLQKTMLSEKEEILIASLSPSGFENWSNLYSALSGTIRVQVEMEGQTQTVGIAQATGMTRSSKEAERKAAWLGIQKAWTEHQEAAAAILNSLAGWRLELYKKRSHTMPVDYLTMPLFQNRIQRETLDAMMTAVQNNKADIQNAARLMAKMHGKEKMDPWDLLAPAPVAKESGSTEFADGLAFIRKAFGSVHHEFGEFIETMEKNQWIESRVLPNKANGAYCTSFLKSKTPRVFQSYLGSNNDISTLAHELGHAYHSWVLRDLPMDEQDYPMTLAETASIFAETVLMDEMISSSTSQEQKIDFAWATIEGAVSLLLNIPARFEFESQFYQKRQEKDLSARELSELTDQAWSKWYGDTLSANDKLFWASKLHFSIAQLSFYNFPCTFGYLFALSIYARREQLGDQFWNKYKEILQDTGRMTAEELIQKHLGEDIRRPEFWQKAIDVVKGKIASFETLLKASSGPGSGSAKKSSGKAEASFDKSHKPKLQTTPQEEELTRRKEQPLVEGP